jgi:hypothetical protein
MQASRELTVDAHALQTLSPLLTGPYLPFTSASMRPAALALVANDVVLHDRRIVLECGSGVSTIVLGRLLASRRGRVVTLEHDRGWARIVRRLVAEDGLEDTVAIVEAALAPVPVGDLEWYDLEVVTRALSGLCCDLLLVDGPPAWREGQELARLPALPLLRQYCAASATIVLDDAGRQGEREIVRAWEREAGISFQVYPAQGVAVAHVGDAPYGLI